MNSNQFSKKQISSCFIVACVLLVASCASNSILPKSPIVKLSSVKPKSMGLTQQEFVFTLKAENQNRFKLPVLGTDFVAKFNGVEVAKGSSTEEIILPANETGTIDVLVKTLEI